MNFLKNLFITMLISLCLMGCNRKVSMKQPRIQLDYFRNENQYIGSILKFPEEMKNIQTNSSYIVFWKFNNEVLQREVPSAPIYSMYSKLNHKIFVVTFSGLYEISPESKVLKQIKLPRKTVNYLAISSRKGNELVICGRDDSEKLCFYYNCLTGEIKEIQISSMIRGATFVDSKIFLNTEENIFEFEITSSSLIKTRNIKKPLSKIKGSWDEVPILYMEQSDKKSFLYWEDNDAVFDCMLKYIGCADEYLWTVDCENRIYKIGKNGSMIFVDNAGSGVIGFGVSNNDLWVSFKDGEVILFNNDGQKNKFNIELPELTE